MILTKTRVIACIYSVYTLIYCLRLYLYNGQLKQLEKQGYNIFYLLSANHYAAIIYFLEAIILCVVAIFIEFFLFKSFGEINEDKEFLIKKQAQTSDFNQGSSPLNYFIYFYHNSL